MDSAEGNISQISSAAVRPSESAVSQGHEPEKGDCLGLGAAG